MLSLEEIIEEILLETTVASGGMGIASALGPNAGISASPFSGDTYAPGDARVPKILGGIARRNKIPNIVLSGMKKRKTKKKHRRRKHRRRKS
jgi:hypothetical protein